MASIISASTTSGTALNMSADTTGVLQLATGATPTTAVTIDASQNVGIGTTSPSYKLDVGNSSGQQIIRANGGSSGSNGGGAFIASNGGTSVFSAGGYSAVFGGAYDGSAAINAATSLTFQATTGSMYWNVNGSERMRIDSSGVLLLAGTSAIAGYQFTMYHSDTGGMAYKYNGTSQQNSCSFQNGNGQVGRIYTSGSATTYSTSSDYRLKENIVPMTGALDKVAQLNPVTFTWKVDGTDGQGFIAHELQTVVPDCVGGTKDAVDAEGNPVYQDIDTSFLVATLTAAIQEQQTIINDLKARIETLETK